MINSNIHVYSLILVDLNSDNYLVVCYISTVTLQTFYVVMQYVVMISTLSFVSICTSTKLEFS